MCFNGFNFHPTRPTVKGSARDEKYFAVCDLDPGQVVGFTFCAVASKFAVVDFASVSTVILKIVIAPRIVFQDTIVVVV